MENKKIIRLVRLTFLLLSLGCIGAVIDLYLKIFPKLNNLFYIFQLELFHLEGAKGFFAAIPVWPVILMSITIVLSIIGMRYLYKVFRSKI